MTSEVSRFCPPTLALALPLEQHSHWRIANPLQKQVAMHRFAPFFVNSGGKPRACLAQNYHQCIQKTGEIGLTEMLTLACTLDPSVSNRAEMWRKQSIHSIMHLQMLDTVIGL